MKISAGHPQFVPMNTAKKVLESGRGFVHAIIATTGNIGTAESLTLYDNTDAAGDVLIRVNLVWYAPCYLIFDRIRPLEFGAGLTAKTSQFAEAFVIIES